MSNNDQWLFVSLTNNGLIILDIRNRSKPVKISELTDLRRGRGMQLYNND